MKRFNSYISEKVRKDPDEEKARLQSRLDRAKTLGQQTRVADALSAARAAAGEKKPSDKRSWGSSTGTAKRLKKTTVRRTPSGISKLLAKRLAHSKKVDISWIDEGASSPKVKRSTSPTIGTFRSGLDPDAPNWTTAAKSLKPRKTTPEGFKKKTPNTQKSTNTVATNLKDSDMLLQTMNLKPEGTTFEVYGTKNGKNYTVKISKVRSVGEVVYMMTGRREVVVSSSGAGLQIHDKLTHKAILTNGNDMIWESFDGDAGWEKISESDPCWKGYKQIGMKNKKGKKVPNCVPVSETAAWTRKAGKNSTGGLNARGVASYRAENPGSKLKTAVTTPPSKLKAGSKAANRRKSFCARMGGMPGPMKDENGKPTRKALSLRKWNC